MKNRLFNMCRFVIGYVRRGRLDALHRRTSENGMWQVTQYPDFLNRYRQCPSELLCEGAADACDHMVQLGAADGRMCFLFDGVRVVCLGARELRTAHVY